MAWDRIQIGIQLNKAISTHGWKYFAMGIAEEGVDAYSLSLNGIDLLYFPNLFGRRILKISFNRGKLYHGDNIASIWACNLQELHQRLNALLDGCIDLNENGQIRYWHVYKYECFADFIIPEQNLNAWFEVISKCSLPYKKIDLTYFNRGTIYFHSGKSSQVSQSNVKIYDKLKERRDRERKDNLPKVDYNQSECINLPVDDKALRIELFHDINPIKRHNKRAVIAESRTRLMVSTIPMS